MKSKKEVKAVDVAEKASDKKETVVAQQATHSQKPRVVVTEKAPKESAERKQQRASIKCVRKTIRRSSLFCSMRKT